MPFHQRKASQSGNPPSPFAAESSPSSSFSSSAGSSMLQHATRPSDSSQSDIASFDNHQHHQHHHSSPSPSASNSKKFASDSLPPLPPPPSSFPPMGQTLSKGQPTPESPSSGPRTAPPVAGHSAGQRFKRAFGGRRKKSEDVSNVFAGGHKGKERAYSDAAITSPPVAASNSHESRISLHGQPLRLPMATKSLSMSLATSTLQMFSGRKAFGLTTSKSASSASASSPPPPPPKPAPVNVPRKKAASSRASDDKSQGQPGSTILTNPTIAPALNFMRESDTEGEPETTTPPARRQREKKDPEREREKEDWRKSDSTMTSHTTVRQTVGSRSPRPLSIAESLQSTHTVVGNNRRLSALVTEPEYATPEEDIVIDLEAEAMQQTVPSPEQQQRTSPPSSVRSRNRRSISLNLSPPFAAKLKGSASEPASSVADNEFEAARYGRPMSPISSSRDSPTLTRTEANGIISSTRSRDNSSPTTANFRGRLAAWTAASGTSPRQEGDLPPLPPPPSRSPAPSSNAQNPSLRQTAISMSNGFAPAAGIAMGFGKRAVEKMGRAWGGLSAGSNGGAGRSSSSVNLAPSSYQGGTPLGPTQSNRSVQTHSSSSLPAKGKGRRTPNAPSATWSITSSGASSSVSESDHTHTPSGPSLGRCLRGPLGSRGVVFGRDLKACVRDTAIESGELGNGGMDMEVVGVRALEGRMLPALVVRCAQHILAWGIEEEGLFRVSGRSSHVNKLRSEFDTGADFDMLACSPGELDPHAVASIFKAYLRELPEPLLTYALGPYFEAALIAETNAINSQGPATHRTRGSQGPTLPSNPRSGAPSMRSPPSLSTLAAPSFAGMRPPSQPLLNALSTLVSRLPSENRDLLRTVTELIKETAKRSKSTKMPLSNLLLVFCPSLNMNPPLLKVLCEAEGIWNGPTRTSEDPVVIDIKREEEEAVVDIQPVDDSDANDVKDDNAEMSYNGELAEEDVEEDSVPAPRRRIPRPRREGLSEDELEANRSTIVVGNQYNFSPRVLPQLPLGGEGAWENRSSSSLSLSSAPSDENRATVYPRTYSDTASSRDDAASYTSTSDVPSSSASGHLYNYYSPPPLTSSAESLSSPSLLSDTPSFPHSSFPEEQSYDKADPSPSSPKIVEIAASIARSSEDSGPPVPFPEPPRVDASPSGARGLRKLASSSSFTLSRATGEQPSPHKMPSFGATMPSMPRLKRPSLHLLLSKRSLGSSPSKSAEPLPSPYMQPSASSASSVSTPATTQTMVTAPQASSSSLPPKLELPLSSPIRLGMEDETEVTDKSTDESSKHPLTSPESLDSVSTVKDAQPIVPTRTESSSTYASSRSYQTSLENLHPKEVRPALRTQASQVSLTPSTFDRLGLSLADESQDTEDDWARSVLDAATTSVETKAQR